MEDVLFLPLLNIYKTNKYKRRIQLPVTYFYIQPLVLQENHSHFCCNLIHYGAESLVIMIMSMVHF